MVADRSKCRRCGTLLTKENCYARKDTHNGLHAYCKRCYLDIQKERVREVSAHGKRYTARIRVGSRTIRLFFDSLEEKRTFMQMRKSLNRCYRSSDTYASVIRIGATPIDVEPSVCDECGGRLRYDENGYLVCEDCFLVAEVMPFYREIGSCMMRGRHAWNGDDADSMCCDVYYTKAYSRGG